MRFNFKSIQSWQKVLIGILFLIVIARIGFIAIRGEVDREYINFKNYDLSQTTGIECKDLSQQFKSSSTRLNSLELIFSNIADDKIGSIVLCIYSDEDLIYKTNLSLANINNNEWKKIYVNSRINSSKEYKITITSTDDCTQIPNVLIVNNNYAPEILKSYISDKEIDGQIVINYGYLRFPSVLDRLVMISLWLLLGLCITLAIIQYEYIAEIYKKLRRNVLQNVKEQTVCTALEILTCLVIVGCSGIEFQEPTKIVLFAISLIASISIENKASYVSKIVDTKWKKMIMIIAYAYAAFTLVGQRIWIYPLNGKLTTAGLTVYVCALIWFIPIVKSMLFYADRICNRLFNNAERRNQVGFVVCTVLLLLVPAAYNLFANNPGISSPDTVGSMVTNAKHLHGMYDWHPFFYSMVLRVITEIWDSTYMVIFVQYFFFAYVLVELLIYLRKKGMKDIVLYGIALFSGANAANYIHLNTIWKDIPYTLSLLWVFVIVVKLVIDNEKYKHTWYIYFELIVAMVGTDLYRKNGVVTFVIVSMCLIPLMKKNIKILASIVICIALIGIVNGPLYSYFEVESPEKRGMYIGLGQDILGVYYNGGEVSEETLMMITNMTNYNNAEYSYTPTWSYQSYDVDVEPVDFIKNYIDTFVKNPIIMLRAIVDREDALWDIYKGEGSILGCVNYTGTMSHAGYEGWDEYYPEREYVSLATEASAASAYTANSQWISAIEWRCGLFTLLGVMVVINLLLKGSAKKLIVIISPMIGHILSLLLSTGWSDFRYFWPMNLLNMSFVLIMFVLLKNNSLGKDEGMKQ